MAFKDLAKGLKLPVGASDRYRKLEALERQLAGELYDDLAVPFETEKAAGKYVPIRERAPSTDFNLAYEITHDTGSELFGDEQFPIITVVKNREQVEDATEEVAEMIDATGIDYVINCAYEDGVIGGVGVILHRSDEGSPFYEIVPAKWCEPVYASKLSNKLLMLVITYPIDRETVEQMFPKFLEENPSERGESYWYRYIVGPLEIVTYFPMLDSRFARLGEKDAHNEVIEFKESRRDNHHFYGRTPALYAKNLGGKPRETDGPALWWPIRNMCIDIDYTLSQASRGLRYGADPMLFVRRGEFDEGGDAPAGMERPAGGMATQTSESGDMVKGATQVLVGTGQHADAKLLEISADGISEEREFVKDLREYALEVVGGMKARSADIKGAQSGTAVDKQSKPLRRLVRRQRRPYGKVLLIDIIDLTLYGYRTGVFETDNLDFDLAKIDADAKCKIEWPKDDVLQGQELLYHITGLQLAAGAPLTAPVQLIKPDVIGAMMAGDLGLHEPYASIKGTGETYAPPLPPAPLGGDPKPGDPKPGAVKP